MKLLTEYLERAIHFERLAAAETDPTLKEQLEKVSRRIPKACSQESAGTWIAAA